jgi:phosphate acetyltransferase
VRAISWQDFRTRAARAPARIILADGDDARAIEAAAMARTQKIADPILLTPKSLQNKEHWIQALLAISKYKSLSRAEAEARIQDPLVLGCLMLREGKADGFVGGATRTTADTLRAVFSIVGLAPKVSTLFGFFFIEAHDGRLVLLADCAVSPEPSPKQLANIAVGAAQAYTYFTGGEPKVALLSFSTHGSAEHPFVDRVRQAVQIAHEKAPTLMIEGEWQADAALDFFSARIKGVGDSPMAGQANVLIAPDLNCGNIAYKLVQRLGGLRAVGPVLWGTALPANDLSRGCSADDILDMMTLTTLQAQKAAFVEKSAHAC